MSVSQLRSRRCPSLCLSLLVALSISINIFSPRFTLAFVGPQSSRVPSLPHERFPPARSLPSRHSNEVPTTPSKNPFEPRVYPQRWTQLAYLSLLALLSDWICFSLAASPAAFEQAYPGSTAASLIDIFLFTNVASCFLVTDVVAKLGLAKSIKGAAALMTLGCLLRSGVPLVTTSELEPYALMVLGTVLVGLAQPYFQCTPPMLSATWFAPNERAAATATALNFNQIGIAIAFLVGGQMAHSQLGIHNYFGLITLITIVVTIGTCWQFQEKPPTPPSYSEMEKNQHDERPFLVSVQQFFQTPGFAIPLAAFVCSISITNIVGTFIGEVMERGGITDQIGIDLAGAGFEIAILLGGIVIGGYVDRTKQYKPVTLACLMATMIFVIPLGLTDHMLGNEPVLLVLALLGLGGACGPIQPINAELAVDVTYPSDETAVESIQQVGGNLVSALMVPVAEWALNQDYEFFKKYRLLDMDIRGDVVLLFAVAAVTVVYYTTFDAPLRRTMADNEDHGLRSGEERMSIGGESGSSEVIETNVETMESEIKIQEFVG